MATVKDFSVEEKLIAVLALQKIDSKIDEIKTPALKIGKTSILERCFNMASAVSAYSKKGLCDVFIEPSLNQFGMFDNDQADAIYKIGYITAIAQKKKLLSLSA